MKQRKNTVLLAAVLVIGLIFAGLGYRMLTVDEKPADTGAVQQSERQPVMLPDFAMEDGDGNTVSSADLQGKPAVINFWATWCGYCVKEMPDFQASYETYGSEINFVMLNATDGKRETKEIADAYLAENGFTFPVYYDTALDAVQACGVTGFPATLFVSAEGEVIWGKAGQISAGELNHMLDAMK